MSQLDYDLIRQNPKVFCGYSDITALQNAIHAQTGLVTYSGPHFSSFGMKKGLEYTMNYFRKCLMEEESFSVKPSPVWSDDLWFQDQENRRFICNDGWYVLSRCEAQGRVVGGNLSTFVLLHGQSRLPELHIQGENLDKLFDRMFQEYSEEEREQIKKKYVTEEAITGAPKRIEAICLDILDHYENHIKPNGFKAQIVAINRETAVLYKKTLDRLNGPESVVIISPNPNKDTDEMKSYLLTKDQQKHYIERFKKPLSEDKLAFIIVCDMLLTGFDAPIEQVMYLDKPLKEHNLLQAIARVNRTYDKKDYGLDYFGVSGFLETGT